LSFEGFFDKGTKREGESKGRAGGVSDPANQRSQVDCREAAEISARKKSIVGILSNVAELGAARMEETISKASLRDATIGTGVAVDKVLALTSQTPSINIVNIPMPTAEERAELTAIDRKLDAIAAKLKA
jgi:hypothetical protein